MAVAIQGAVIVEQRGNSFVYRKKCHCGYVDSSTTTTGGGGVMSTNFMCPRCKTMVPVKIDCSR